MFPEYVYSSRQLPTPAKSEFPGVSYAESITK